MAKEIKEFRNPILAPKMVSIPKRERLFQAMDRASVLPGFGKCVKLQILHGKLTDEERVRHVRQLLRVLVGQRQRGGLLVGYDVVHEGGAARPGVAQPHGLREIKKKQLNSRKWKKQQTKSMLITLVRSGR